MNKNIIYKKHMEDKMQDKGLDFKHKEVVNISNGKSNKLINIFSQNNDIVIPWKNIKCIGDDLILVEI